MTAPTEHDREALVRRLRNKLFDNPDFRNPGNPSYRKGYVDGLNDMTDEFKAALTAQGGEQTADTVSVSASSWAKLREVFARRFPRCRDCADEAGVCPHSGLPCEFDSMLLPTAAADTVSVPREPSDREIEAMEMAWLTYQHPDEANFESTHEGRELMRRLGKAMLAAAAKERK